MQPYFTTVMILNTFDNWGNVVVVVVVGGGGVAEGILHDSCSFVHEMESPNGGKPI